MTKLHLGVVDIPYVEEGTTTGEVAEKLEKTYHIMETFYNLRKEKVASEIEIALQKSIDELVMTGHVAGSPFSSVESFLDDSFREFLTNQEIEKVGIAGVPTKAALEGITSRKKAGKNTAGKKKGKKFGKRRPSFIDSGLYQSSMKTWFDL